MVAQQNSAQRHAHSGSPLSPMGNTNLIQLYRKVASPAVTSIFDLLYVFLRVCLSWASSSTSFSQGSPSGYLSGCLMKAPKPNQYLASLVLSQTNGLVKSDFAIVG